MKTTKTYLALGDSMSIDNYAGVDGGGAVAQFHKRLVQRGDATWTLDDRTFDGCTIGRVPETSPLLNVALITMTIGGNDLLQNMDRDLREYVPKFERAYRDLLGGIRKRHPKATVIVGNIYHPQADLPPNLEEALRRVNLFIAETIQQNGFRLADIFGAFRGHEQEYLCLGIEPTLKGATMIADLFERAFQHAAT
jgi:lysophospholipase L1-like esterase